MSTQSEPDSSGSEDLLSGGADSRQTNHNKSVNLSNAGSEGFDNCDLHTKAKIEKCVSDFVEKYPKKARTRIATGDRRKLRREYAAVEQVEWREDLRLSEEEYKDIQLPDTRPSGVRDGEVTPLTWTKALHKLLHKYAATKETTIHLNKTLFDSEETYDVEAQSRWQPEYQKRFKAQLDGWLRETTGGDRPTGGKTEASFENPHIALITLSGSSVPNGERIGPVDLFSEFNSTWSDHTYHAVRNTLRSLGFDSDEWHYDRRAEPHANEKGDKTGVNACYGHEHIVLVIDGEVSEAELRPIVDKHVEKCEFAGERAHAKGDEGPIVVTTPDEKDDIASYVADYASLAPVDLLDRAPEYQAFAAAATAANYRTVTRSEAARQAAKADKCRQRFESDKSEQLLDHGEEVEYDNGDICCTECGCTHDINQQQTIAECRKPDNADTTPPEPTVADGGCKIPTDESRRRQLAEQWQDANQAASIGELTERTRVRRRIQMVKDAHPDKDAIELAAKFDAIDHIDIVGQVLSDNDKLTNFDKPVGFGQDREPEWADPDWRIKEVSIRGETHSAAGGNGMDYVKTTDYVERFADVIDDDHWYRCNCGVKMHGTEMSKHLGYEHGLETKKQARLSVEIESHDSE